MIMQVSEERSFLSSGFRFGGVLVAVLSPLEAVRGR
jgi:hypothetical protein